ncbi:UPF0651 protein YPL107W, mitochondrial [Aspergillus udagawae]|uniref:UPF0651 protein YPL107W, mitochondrial n=1 Tax=Aspergillus udagawae TaxID=91492 RepID=A0ABQ1B2Q5_9EURO|nr:UPF0651 protein YPL107W, mitochondrial [Aspergillus udagawae]GFF91254.1 UPF0651 protein YPL107W, mitochondrial [Aspergillus udagawae]GFG03229.1 UPF0651 protein YPL107W, mitochondrial [Aspergillus udagawae]GFG24851.1 UPF0651 protein YPL107W, mitochondrial [Aspergillus udagawae]
MECFSMHIRQSILRCRTRSLCFRHVRVTNKLSLPSWPTLSVTRQYAFTPSSHRGNTHDDTLASLEDSTRSQAHPLSGYYYDILSSQSPYRSHPPTSRPASQAAEKPSLATTVKPQSPEEKMSIVFGSRLAGPGRASRYNPGTMPPESQWKMINGVAIPPRPEEPDNCCMSGCVHCVWDDYRDEMEEWASRVGRAKVKGSTQKAATDMRQTPRAEVESASHSMDDDGGGSESNRPVSYEADDLFANIPVGIREFMKTEKKLKEKKQHEKTKASI